MKPFDRRANRHQKKVNRRQARAAARYLACRLAMVAAWEESQRIREAIFYKFADAFTRPSLVTSKTLSGAK